MSLTRVVERVLVYLLPFGVMDARRLAIRSLQMITNQNTSRDPNRLEDFE